MVVLWPALSQPELLLAGHDVATPYNAEINNRFALSRSQLPLWNPFIMSGLPGLADFQSGLLYPPNVVLRLLPPEAFISVLVALHLWLGGAGAYLFARDLGISRVSATLAGLSVALGGAVTPRILAGMPHFIAGIAWVPWIMMLARRAASQNHARPHAGLTLALAAQYLAGYAQIFIYTLAVVAVQFAWAAIAKSPRPRAIWPRLGRGLLALSLTAGFAAGLLAIQVVPGVQFFRETGRTAGLEFEQAARWSLDSRDALALLFPRAFAVSGKPFHEDSGALLWEKSPYLGFAVPALAIVGAIAGWRSGESRFLAGLAAVTLLFALGQEAGLYHLHHLILPGFRYPGRLLPIVAVATSLLAAMGLDALLRWSGDKTAQSRARLIGLAIGATLLLPAVVDAVGDATSGAGLNGLALGSPWWIVIATAFAVLVLSFIVRLRRPAVGAGLVVAVTAADLVWFASPFVVLDDAPRQDDLAAALAKDGASRVVSACEEGYSALRPLNPPVPMVDALNPAFFKSYAQFTQLTQGDPVTASYRQAPTVWSDTPERMDLLALLNATHMVKCTPFRGDQFTLVDRVDGIYIYRFRDAFDRAEWFCDIDVVDSEQEAIDRLSNRRRDARREAVVQRPSGAGTLYEEGECREDAELRLLSWDNPDGELEVHVSSPTSGLVLLAEPYFSGRRAWVDGTEAPTLRANLAFTGLVVPPGAHRVQLRYAREPFVLGGVVSLVTAVVLGLWSLRFGRLGATQPLWLPTGRQRHRAYS